MDRLPPEVIAHLWRFSDFSTFNALTLVCRELRHKCQPLLFEHRSLFISDASPARFDSLEDYSQRLSTLSSLLRGGEQEDTEELPVTVGELVRCLRSLKVVVDVSQARMDEDEHEEEDIWVPDEADECQRTLASILHSVTSFVAYPSLKKLVFLDEEFSLRGPASGFLFAYLAALRAIAGCNSSIQHVAEVSTLYRQYPPQFLSINRSQQHRKVTWLDHHLSHKTNLAPVAESLRHLSFEVDDSRFHTKSMEHFMPVLGTLAADPETSPALRFLSLRHVEWLRSYYTKSSVSFSLPSPDVVDLRLFVHLRDLLVPFSLAPSGLALLATLSALPALRSVILRTSHDTVYGQDLSGWPTLPTVTRLGIVLEGRDKSLDENNTEQALLSLFPNVRVWLVQDMWSINNPTPGRFKLGDPRRLNSLPDLLLPALAKYSKQLEAIETIVGLAQQRDPPVNLVFDVSEAVTDLGPFPKLTRTVGLQLTGIVRKGERPEDVQARLDTMFPKAVGMNHVRGSCFESLLEETDVPDELLSNRFRRIDQMEAELQEFINGPPNNE